MPSLRKVFMASNINKNTAITSRDQDFAQWYTDVCKKAELMNYSTVKGFINYLPYGYAIWEEIQNYLNKRFKEIGSNNVYLPLVIPESLFSKEKEHVEGFAPECLVATIGGGEKLSDPLIIRPTSEVLFSDLFKGLVSSYRDLPLLLNQWCSVVRWEKTTRPFLRGSEFLWQEGHCLFETEKESEENALKVLDVYDDLGRDLLAIPFVKGTKTPHERFAGASETYTIEALMHDGKSLQSGTTHALGTGFAKAAGIQYLGRDNKLDTPYQSSWGVSTRLIGAIIMVHGDDNGLVLPPAVAPIQVVIIPVRQQAEGVLKTCREVASVLKAKGIRVKVDESDKTPGWKFNEYEMKGVPLRLEIGPRDIESGVLTIAKRVSGEKSVVPISEAEEKIPEILSEIHLEMYQKALAHLNSNITPVKTKEELLSVLEKGGYAKAMWDGTEETEMKVKELSNGGTSRCLPFDQTPVSDVDPVSGKKAEKVLLYAKAY